MDQSELLRYAIEVLERLAVPYLVVGSIASSAYGEPRLTLDIDIVVDLGEDKLDSFCAAFPLPEFYVSRDAARRAIYVRRQFNVLHPASGQKIDFVVAGDDDWGRSQLRRARQERILPERDVFTGAPEDIIISKMRYYRQSEQEKHLRDIAGMMKVSGDRIDRAYVAHWAEKLLLTDIWHAILRRLGEEVPPAARGR